MFDLILSRNDNNVYVRARVGDTLTNEHALGPSCSLDMLEDFAERVAKAAQYDTEFKAELLAQAQNIYQAVFQKDVLDKLTRASATTTNPFVLRLIIEDARLQAIPWEALCKPNTQESFLAKGTEWQVVRGVTSTETIAPQRVDGALRVLVVGRDILASTLNALKTTTQTSSAVEWLDPILGPNTTWEHVNRRIRTANERPHVVHFFGHGRLQNSDPEAPDKPGASLVGLSNDANDDEAWITAETLADELHANFADGLRLLVLETCSGAAPGAFGSAAQILIRSGVHATLSYLWPIKAAMSLDASRLFYEALTRGHATRGNVSASVSAARRSLLMNRATGFSLVLHARSTSPVLFDFVPQESNLTQLDKPLVKKEKPNVLAKEPRKKALSSFPPPAPVVAGNRTRMVLDRVHQWNPIVKKCISESANWVFIVHGTPEQNLSEFLKRIRVFLVKSCRSVPHSVVEVDRTSDNTLTRTPEEWKRCFVEHSEAKRGQLDAVILRETREERPVYLFTEHGDPLHLDKPTLDGLLGFFQAYVDSTLNTLIAKNALTHPVRFVLPVEHAKPGVDKDLETLHRGLQNLLALKVELLEELQFPPWPEVWEYIVSAFPRAKEDAAFETKCRDIHRKFDKLPKRTLKAFADALHPVLYEWDEAEVRHNR